MLVNIHYSHISKTDCHSPHEIMPLQMVGRSKILPFLKLYLRIIFQIGCLRGMNIENTYPFMLILSRDIRPISVHNVVLFL